MYICFIRPQGVVNTLRPGHNERHFPDDIFKCTFLNENVSISIKISLKFLLKGRIRNISSIGSDNDLVLQIYGPGNRNTK